MPVTGQQVCGGGVVVWWWCGGWLKPTLVFSLAKAEQLPPYIFTISDNFLIDGGLKMMLISITTFYCSKSHV